VVVVVVGATVVVVVVVGPVVVVVVGPVVVVVVGPVVVVVVGLVVVVEVVTPLGYNCCEVKLSVMYDPCNIISVILPFTASVGCT
jgi:hypothetical protein